MKYEPDIVGIGLVLFLLFMAVMITILVFRGDGTYTLTLSESNETVLLDAMRDLHQSMEKLNEALREFKSMGGLENGGDAVISDDNQGQ